MKTRLFRSFSVELQKIATGVGADADIRKTLAEREGEEYLEGGLLPENSDDLYFPTNDGDNEGLYKHASFGVGIASMDFKAKKKDEGPYQHVRDWGWRGLQGAAAGSGITKLVKDMKGKTMHAKDYRHGAAVGAGVALGDRLWRHRKELQEDISKKMHRRRGKTKEAAGVVSPSPERVVKSPAARLAASSKTGKFRKGVHMGKPPRGLRIGKKFRLPGAL